MILQSHLIFICFSHIPIRLLASRRERRRKEGRRRREEERRKERKERKREKEKRRGEKRKKKEERKKEEGRKRKRKGKKGKGKKERKEEERTNGCPPQGGARPAGQRSWQRSCATSWQSVAPAAECTIGRGRAASEQGAPPDFKITIFAIFDFFGQPWASPGPCRSLAQFFFRKSIFSNFSLFCS